jgi:hypothetical protein
MAVKHCSKPEQQQAFLCSRATSRCQLVSSWLHRTRVLSAHISLVSHDGYQQRDGRHNKQGPPCPNEPCVFIAFADIATQIDEGQLFTNPPTPKAYRDTFHIAGSFPFLYTAFSQRAMLLLSRSGKNPRSLRQSGNHSFSIPQTGRGRTMGPRRAVVNAPVMSVEVHFDKFPSPVGFLPINHGDNHGC